MRLDLHDKTGDRAIIALRTPYIFDYALHKMPAIGIAHNYFNSTVTTVILDIILVKPIFSTQDLLGLSDPSPCTTTEYGFY
jgi:hypothetical protein